MNQQAPFQKSPRRQPPPATEAASAPGSAGDMPFSPSAHARYGHSLDQLPAAERAVPVNQGGGSPLPAPVRGKMERSFGHSFADVRIHSGGEAEQAGALAYTRGSDIHFRPGLYDTASLDGQGLLGHELTHVVQQRAGRVSSPQSKGVGSAPINDDTGLEGEADEMGARAARGEQASVSGTAAGTQRKSGQDAPVQCKGPGLFSRLKGLIGRGDAALGAAPEEEGGLSANPLWDKGAGEAGMSANPLWQSGNAPGGALDAAPPALGASLADSGPAWTTPTSTPRTPRMDALGTRAGGLMPPAPLLPGISPGAEYKDEDKKLGWRAAMDPAVMAAINGTDPEAAAAALARKQRAAERTDLRVTKYLTPEQRAEHAVTADDSGLLTRANGKLLNTKNGAGGGLSPTDGTEIFAMGTDGSLHAADVGRESSARRLKFLAKQAQYGMPKNQALAEAKRLGKRDELFHHSSFFAGGAVAGAGEIQARKGRVTEISDQSGHYKPKAETTFSAVSHMAKSKAEGGLGISLMDQDAREARVRLGAKPGMRGGEISLPASSFLQTGGNEQQIRAKKGLLPELEYFTKKKPPALVPDGGADEKKQKSNAVANDGVDDSPQASPSQIHAQLAASKNASMPAWMQQLPARPRSQVGADAYGWLQDAGVPDVEPVSKYSMSYAGQEDALEDEGSSASPYSAQSLLEDEGKSASPYSAQSLLEDEGKSASPYSAQSLLEDEGKSASPYSAQSLLEEEGSSASPYSAQSLLEDEGKSESPYGENSLGLDATPEELPSFMQD